MPSVRLVPVVWLIATLTACAGAACHAPLAAPAAARSRITLSIVGTNDLHGGILQREDRGGLALLGGYVANLRAARARDGGAVLLIDAGDMFQGTLESNLNEGATVVAAYNALGYTAAAVGNHEFDFGPVGPAGTPQRPDDDARGALKARAAEASFPFLAANLIDNDTGRPVAWRNVMPSTTLTAAGVRIGIVGVMTLRALTTTIAANTRGLSVAPLAETIEAEAARLRAGGASVVVVAAHAGGRCSDFSNPRDLSSCDLSDELVGVVQALRAGLVDVVIAGHTHAAMAHQLDGVAVSEAYTGGRAFGRVDVVVDRASKKVIERRSFAPRDLCARVDPGTARCEPGDSIASRVPAGYEGAPVSPDAGVAKVIAPAVEAARAQKAMPLGVTVPRPIRKGQNTGADSPLGNLFADAYLAAVPGADVAVNNTEGGLRMDLPSGPLTYGAVFEVMPFDNRLVAFRLTGADLRSVLAARVRLQSRLPTLAGLRARVACRDGVPDIAVLRPDGAAVEDNDRVLVVATDFLATGGDRIFEPVIPADGFAIDRDAGGARDVVVEALRKHGGTLREDQLVDPANPRWVLPGPMPVTCGRR